MTEGAGGAAEINLLDRDIVNLPLARAAGIPALLVVDIDRGGAFAAAHCTIDLMPESLRSTIAGSVFNRFRGDPTLLEPGIRDICRRDGVPVLGVLSHLGDEPLAGVEDSLDVPATAAAPRRSDRPVRVAVVRLPHLADAVVHTDARVVGICAGCQMLGGRIADPIESGEGDVAALGLLDVETTFEHPKIVRRRTGSVGGHPVHGYEIRFGRPIPAERAWLRLDDGDEGAVSGDRRVYGTSLHGLFDADAFRTEFLAEVAAARGRRYDAAPVTFAQRLEDQHERLADWLEAGVDVEALDDVAARAVAPGAEPGW